MKFNPTAELEAKIGTSFESVPDGAGTGAAPHGESLWAIGNTATGGGYTIHQ